MASKIFGPRKRRTRQHVIADLSVHHVEGFILEEGHTAERTSYDYGYDLVLTTYDRQGYVESDLIFLQVKATERLQAVRSGFCFDVDIRDYFRWINEKMPVILVLFDAVGRCAYWQDIQGFFEADEARQPRVKAKNVRVHLPKEQIMSRAAIREFRRLKVGH